LEEFFLPTVPGLFGGVNKLAVELEETLPLLGDGSGDPGESSAGEDIYKGSDCYIRILLQ
jgi:hypothetical protein